MDNLSRRDLLKAGTAAAVGLAISSITIKPTYAQNEKNVRIGFIGTGGRGTGLLDIMLRSVEGVEIAAVCDINEQRVKAAQDLVVSKGRKKPEAYSKDEYAYRKLLERDDIDAVIIASPWDWHARMAVDTMKSGKYAGVEVPCVWTLDECWDLVNTHEKTNVPCMMLENWSFRKDNLAVLNMIRKGLFGEIIHCHCAHTHNCVDYWFFDAAPWSAKFLEKYNRDQYPCHQLGPVISWMDIGCGDYFDYITSTATKGGGINDSFIRRFGKDHPNAARKFAQGDIVTTVIKTKNGKTIVDNFDMLVPRPYDNRWLIQGRRGLYDEMGGDTAGAERKSVYFTPAEGATKGEAWEPFAPYEKEYEHKWTKMASAADAELHGGTDPIELKLFVEAVRNKTQTPIDVYDSVAMCVTGPLSEKSIASGSKPIEVPDFTRGKWKTKKPTFGI
jgi:predicted dehydrogenase